MAEPIRVPEGFGDDTDSLTLSPSGTMLAIFARERPGFRAETLAVYATADGRLLGGPEEVGDCRTVAFTDETTLLLASAGHCLRWQLPGRPVRLGPPPGKFVTALAGHAGSAALAVAISSDPNGVVVLDLASGEQRLALPLPWPYELEARDFTFSADGRMLATALRPFKGDEEAILVWDLTTARRLRMHLPGRFVCAMCFARGDDTLFAALEETVEVYGAGQFEPIRSLPLPKKLSSALPAMGQTPDGSAIELMDCRGYWARIDVATGQVLHDAGPPVELAEDYGREALSMDGRVAAAVARDRTIAVWRVGE